MITPTGCWFTGVRVIHSSPSVYPAAEAFLPDTVNAKVAVAPDEADVHVPRVAVLFPAEVAAYSSKVANCD